ncbi:MAG: hypothetical protein GY855_10520, partial [candidate division Zixibacteria bacterium]|nr:hypothetical protein [candidate division Zixibacteria bacterium]
VSDAAKGDAWSTFIRDSWLLVMALFIYIFDNGMIALDKLRLRNAK